nr:uncharacterized protein LOC111856031 isoform X2 [Paramormyrops kingsleyae]
MLPQPAASCREETPGGTMAAGGLGDYEVDLHLSVGFLREQLGGTIEEAVRTAVETVLCETVRLLGQRLGFLHGARAQDSSGTQSLKLRLEATGGEWKVGGGGDQGAAEMDFGVVGKTARSMNRANFGTQKPHLHGGDPDPPHDEQADFGVFSDPFDMDSTGARVEDFEEGQDMGLPEDWELMNKVYKVEHSEGLSFIDEGGTAHYAEDYLMHDRDLRIITVPQEEELPQPDTPAVQDSLTKFSPADIKKEAPEAQSSSTVTETPALPPAGEPQSEGHGAGEPPVEFGPQNYLEQLRLWLERLCPEVMREYERDGCLCELSRRKLIKFAVSFIMDEFGFYPTSAQKTMLAEHIVELFPSLRLCVPYAGINGVEHLYDPVSRTGYIETRLRNFRRTLEADKKKYVLKRRRAELGLVSQTPVPKGAQGGEETRKWVALLKRTSPLTKNLPTIRAAMECTFAARRKWMSSERPSMGAVLAEYPRFLDVPSMIDLEFEKMFPGKGDAFLSKWSSHVVPRVRQIAEREGPPEVAELLQQASSQPEDSCTLTMLKVLVLLLPPSGTGRASQATKSASRHTIHYLVDLVPMDTKVSTLFRDPTAEATGSPARPYILSVGPLDAPGRQLYILAPAERVALTLPEGSLSSAVDKLFKFLKIFNLDYPIQLSSLYSFLEHLYGIEKPHSTPSGKRSKVLELVSGLRMLS